MKTITEIITIIEATNPRSAWNKGVKSYALEILADMPRNVEYGTMVAMQRDALNGARDWEQYSRGGCSLAYDEDIAKRLCTPSELKKTRNGMRRPNSRETWIDVQTRALYQAFRLIHNAALDVGYLF